MAKRKQKRAKATGNAEYPISEVVKILRREVKRWPTPIVTLISEEDDAAYKVLVSTVISLRTQDKTTAEASARLFKLAETPETMIEIAEASIAKAIYPAGFYNTKAKTIIEVSRVILDEYGGRTPDSVEELVKLKGVGRKTANLVVTLGYGKPGICVDTHVHRIANRWGYVTSKSPDETEKVLREILPRRYWIGINDWLVTYGQNLCKPTSPHCSECRLIAFCDRRGVTRSR